MSWEKTDKPAKKHEETCGLFACLSNDGDRVVGAFLDEPGQVGQTLPNAGLR